MSEQNEKIIELREQIESLEKLHGVLEPEVIEEKLSKIKAQLDQLIQTQGGAYVAGSVFTRGGDFNCSTPEMGMKGDRYTPGPPGG